MGFRALATGMQLLTGLEKKRGRSLEKKMARHYPVHYPVTQGAAYRHSRKAQIKRVFGPDFFSSEKFQASVTQF